MGCVYFGNWELIACFGGGGATPGYFRGNLDNNRSLAGQHAWHSHVDLGAIIVSFVSSHPCQCELFKGLEFLLGWNLAQSN